MRWLRSLFTGRKARPVQRPAIVTLQLEELEGRETPSVATPGYLATPYTGSSTSASAPFTPSQVRSAYGISSISFSGVAGNGAGQTIAIIDAYHDPNIASDLAAFDSTFGLPAPPSFKVLNQLGQSSYLPGTDPTGLWTLEEAMDVEWAHAMAPGANIILFEANSSNMNDLLQAVSTAAHTPGVTVVSMSWGVQGGFAGEGSLDRYFNVPGVTFFASTGDSGAPGNYPAESPYVVAVGGSTLSISSSGSYGGETAWSGSGGGVSSYEGRPGYQNLVNSVVGGQRGTPDVSFDANPTTGVYVYDTFNSSSFGGSWLQVGGTSLGAPCWAGLMAIVNQGRTRVALGTMSSVQTLQALYGLPSSDFHDVTNGNNGKYSARAGYDLVSGLGTPVANLLVPALAGNSSAKPIAGGSAGGYQVADFHGSGVYLYSSSAGWRQLNGTDATALSVDANGDVVAEFWGLGVYLWTQASGWKQISTANATQLNMAGNQNIVAQFPGIGIWRYEPATGWQQINKSGATITSIGTNGDVVAEIPSSGVWLYQDSTGWRNISTANASQLSMAGVDDIVALFPGIGVWRFEPATGWQQISKAAASLASIDSKGDVVVEIPGAGVWLYQDSTGWKNINLANATQVSIADNGVIAVNFPGIGYWCYQAAAGWQNLTTLGTNLLEASS